MCTIWKRSSAPASWLTSKSQWLFPSWWLTHITTVDLAACEALFYYFHCCNTSQLLQSLEMLWYFGSMPCEKALLPEARWSCCTTERKQRRLWNPYGDKGGQGVSLTKWLGGIVSSLSAGNWRCRRALVPVQALVSQHCGVRGKSR